MKYLPIFILIILISCGGDNPADNGEITEPENTYLPLQVDNEWIYETTRDSSYIHIKITGTELINDKKYYIYVDDEDTSHIRTDNGIAYFEYIEGKEYLYRYFKDTTIYENRYRDQKLDCRLVEDTIETIAGNFENIAFVGVGDHEVDAGFTLNYSKSVGLLKKVWFGGSTNLIYAKIGNKTYGERPI